MAAKHRLEALPRFLGCREDEHAGDVFVETVHRVDPNAQLVSEHVHYRRRLATRGRDNQQAWWLRDDQQVIVSEENGNLVH